MLFTCSCLYEGSCLIYVICVCLRKVVSNTYCVVFLFFVFDFVFVFCFFLRLVYPMLPVSQDCPILIAPSVFSNVHLPGTCISGIMFIRYDHSQKIGKPSNCMSLGASKPKGI